MKRIGKLNFWILFVGFNLTFFPMHILGLKRHDPADLYLSARDGLGTCEPSGDHRRVHHGARRSRCSY